MTQMCIHRLARFWFCFNTRLIEDLKARKEAAMKKVTRTSGPAPDRDDWHNIEPPEEVPF